MVTPNGVLSDRRAVMFRVAVRRVAVVSELRVYAAVGTNHVASSLGSMAAGTTRPSSLKTA